MPDFSIIIPAFNEEKYLPTTLQSLSDQTHQDYEIIVVANGCTDKTIDIAKKNPNPKLKLYTLPKANVSRARNFGAGKAQGDMLLFLDADTRLEKDSLQKIKESFTKEHAVATTKVKPDSPELKFRIVSNLKNIYNQTFYQGCSGALICLRQDFDKVNGYNPNISVKEHRKLILQLKKMGKYKCIDTYATTSMRRFQEWSLTKTALFWTKQWIKDKFGALESSEYEKIR